jgi:hypothetical protein
MGRTGRRSIIQQTKMLQLADEKKKEVKAVESRKK